MKLLVVAGARPNFMKVAPLMWEIGRRSGITPYLVHTGQHYDHKMSHQFFEELRIPRPDVDLGVGSGSHAVQTAEVMKRVEPVIERQKPDALVVVGDVNSTIACALTAVKMGVPVAHVEAGLRSFDRTMPEEINRILTDAISEWLFVSERAGVDNLRKEGTAEGKIHFVGNVMIDALLASRDKIDQSPVVERLGLKKGGYAVATLHRPSNVDRPEVFTRLMSVLGRLQQSVPVVFPVHPRTRKVIESGAGAPDGMLFIEPLGYFDFVKLVADSRLVLTDSGGIQEETTVLGVPCLTLRENTERPATIDEGTNVLVGTDPVAIEAALGKALAQPGGGRSVPRLWDGKAAGRIIDVLVDAL